LLQMLETWIGQTLGDFARDCLKPGTFAGLLARQIDEFLSRRLGSDRSEGVVGRLLLGIRPDPEADLARGLADLQAGRLDQPGFLDRFGHRCAFEMELSQPRWVEDRAALDHMISTAVAPLPPGGNVPKGCEEVAQQAALTDAERQRLQLQVQALGDLVCLRET